MRALNLLRSSLHYRKSAFDRGLEAAGYALKDVRNPKPGDALIIWNRYSGNHEHATVWEKAGADVFIVENGWLSKGWRGGEWFAVSRSHHGAGWIEGGPERWDSWGVEPEPWRQGSEVLLLGQRSIGEPGIASPDHWAENLQKQVGGRIRPHPGKDKPKRTLADDLRSARCVLTWNSSAALLALLSGVPVFHAHPGWIGASAAKPLAAFLAGEEPLMDDGARLAMFRRLAHSMYTLDEIASGMPFAKALACERL